MASYHFSSQIIGRAKGHSAIKAAAYRAGQNLRDEQSGELHHYSRRGGVEWASIFLPPNTAERLADRQTLWNEVERMEVRSDAQLARDINIALPHELSRADQTALVVRFVTEQFVAKGMIADVALHVPRSNRGEDMRNVHVHVMLTLRQGTPEGLRPVKTRAWNSIEQLKVWRAAWEEYGNHALALAGSEARLDSRSLAEQREGALHVGDEARSRSFDREPEMHMGPNAIQMFRKAISAERRKRETELRDYRRTPLPYKVADNAGRIERNQNRAWNRHAEANALEVWRERLNLLRPAGPVRFATLKDGTVLSYDDLASRHDRPEATSSVGKIVSRMRDTEISQQAIKVLRSQQHDLDHPVAELVKIFTDAQMRPVAKSPFHITAKDFAFSFYRMGFLSLERLRDTLELIEAEAELRRASARMDGFWERLVPRTRSVELTRGNSRRRTHQPNASGNLSVDRPGQKPKVEA